MATALVYTSTAGRLERIEVDAALSRSAEHSVEVTRFPVEAGSVISDHAIENPDRFQLSGLITNTPAMDRDKFNAGVGAGTISTRRAQEGRDRLEQIKKSKIVVTLEANGRQHDNLIMVGLSFPEDGATGDAVAFSASFEQIRTATTSVEAVPAPPVAKTAKVKGGKKPTEKASAPVKKRVSLLEQIRRAAVGG